jgi:hypothetical protein
MGEDVKIAPVGIAHGSLQVTVKVDLGVSHRPFSQGRPSSSPTTRCRCGGGGAASSGGVSPRSRRPECPRNHAPGSDRGAAGHQIGGRARRGSGAHVMRGCHG